MRWLVDEVKLAHVLNTHRFEAEDGATQVASEYLWERVLLEAAESAQSI